MTGRFASQSSPNTGVAQSVEHWSPKPGVESSNLSTRATISLSAVALASSPEERIILGALVQLVRISPCHGGGHGFESRTHRTKHAKIAQLVEHDLAKVGVAGSSPVFRSSKRFLIVNYPLSIIN